jgi:glycosyltransferase involved in cell wall biosynthesis
MAMARLVHLAIDVVGTREGGGQRVLEDILSEACASAEIGTVSVFCSPRAVRRYSLPDDRRIRQIECARLDRSPALRAVWFRIGVPTAVKRLGADVFLSLNNGGTARPWTPSATLIQQSIPFSPEALSQHSLLKGLYFAFVKSAIAHSCAHADTVFVQSETMRRMLSEHCGTPRQKTLVLRPAPSLVSAANPAPNAEQGSVGLARMEKEKAGTRILYVGRSGAYKNLGRLFEAMRILRQRRPGARLFTTLEPGEEGSDESAVALGHLTPAALLRAYSHADILVFPSLVETVGLPLLEALELGVPVAASDRAYAHEVCEHAATYFDPTSPSDIAAKLLVLLEDQALRLRLRDAGRSLIEKRRAGRPYARMVEELVRLGRFRSTPQDSQSHSLTVSQSLGQQDDLRCAEVGHQTSNPPI